MSHSRDKNNNQAGVAISEPSSSSTVARPTAIKKKTLGVRRTTPIVPLEKKKSIGLPENRQSGGQKRSLDTANVVEDAKIAQGVSASANEASSSNVAELRTKSALLASKDPASTAVISKRAKKASAGKSSATEIPRDTLSSSSTKMPSDHTESKDKVTATTQSKKKKSGVSAKKSLTSTTGRGGKKSQSGQGGREKTSSDSLPPGLNLGKRKDNHGPLEQRRLDSLARLMAGEDKCVAVCVVGDQLWISANELNVGEDNEYKTRARIEEAVKSVLGYFRDGSPAEQKQILHKERFRAHRADVEIEEYGKIESWQKAQKAQATAELSKKYDAALVVFAEVQKKLDQRERRELNKAQSTLSPCIENVPCYGQLLVK